MELMWSLPGTVSHENGIEDSQQNPDLHRMITIALIEDDPVISDGLELFIDSQPDLVCLLSVSSAEAFEKQSGDIGIPQVILLDIGLPGMSGLDYLPVLTSKFPDSAIVMLTVHEEADSIFTAIQRGATGYLLKSTPFPEIRRALEQMAAGGSVMSPSVARKVLAFIGKPAQSTQTEPLTPREMDIVNGLVNGQTYQEIANQHQISLETVRHHIKNIYRKCRVDNKADIIRMKLNREI